MLPAKGKYLEYDVRRTKERAGKPEITPPEDFASMSHTVLVRPVPVPVPVPGALCLALASPLTC